MPTLRLRFEESRTRICRCHAYPTAGELEEWSMSKRLRARLAVAGVTVLLALATNPVVLRACVTEQFVVAGHTLIAFYSYCGGSCDLCIDLADSCNADCYSAWQEGIINTTEERQCEAVCRSGMHQCLQACSV